MRLCGVKVICRSTHHKMDRYKLLHGILWVTNINNSLSLSLYSHGSACDCWASSVPLLRQKIKYDVLV